MFCLSLRYKKAIFSLNTALFLHGLTDRTPTKYEMSFPENYGIQKISSEVRAIRETAATFGEGAIAIVMPNTKQPKELTQRKLFLSNANFINSV